MKWETYLDIAYGVLLLGIVITVTNLNNDWFLIGAVIGVSSFIPFLKSVHGFSEERGKQIRDKVAETEKGEENDR